MNSFQSNSPSLKIDHIVFNTAEQNSGINIIEYMTRVCLQHRHTVYWLDFTLRNSTIETAGYIGLMTELISFLYNFT